MAVTGNNLCLLYKSRFTVSKALIVKIWIMNVTVAGNEYVGLRYVQHSRYI